MHDQPLTETSPLVLLVEDFEDAREMYSEYLQFTGLRVAIALALVAITATEMVASNDGLGYLVWNSWQLFQPPNMYVGLVAIALIGAVSTGVVLLAERVALPWSTRH